jgi:predicted DNA-binding protein
MSRAFNISLPDKWSELISEISSHTGESMASIIQRATIAYLESANATGIIDKLRSESNVDKSAE